MPSLHSKPQRHAEEVSEEVSDIVVTNAIISVHVGLTLPPRIRRREENGPLVEAKPGKPSFKRTGSTSGYGDGTFMFVWRKTESPDSFRPFITEKSPVAEFLWPFTCPPCFQAGVYPAPIENPIAKGGRMFFYQPPSLWVVLDGELLFLLLENCLIISGSHSSRCGEKISTNQTFRALFLIFSSTHLQGTEKVQIHRGWDCVGAVGSC